MPSVENQRLAKNTIFLYIRMFLVMGVGLFTSRVILNALGENDFGIYNVVGGMVALFSVVSSSLAASISRYITFELGKENSKRLKEIFSTSLAVQFIIASLIILIGSPIGFWFLNNKMNIAPERMYSANWVLVFSLLSFIINLISVPYNASLIAHERMKAFAYVGMFEAFIKLGISYLIYVFKDDRLIFYALLLFLLSLTLRIIYGIYCSRNFEECRTKIHYYPQIFKEMSGYAGWSFIGTSSSIVQRQGSNIILNLFFGTIINAAFGIGTQVANAVTNFSNNFLTALNPQITKNYAQGDYSHLTSLIFTGSRFGFFLLWIISVIILLKTNYILHFWLKEVPDYTIEFVQLFLIFALIQTISAPIVTTLMATGEIKTYQIVVGGFRFIDLPICYLVLKSGFPPFFSVLVSICLEVILTYLRLLFIKKFIRFKIKDFIFSVLSRIFLVIFSSYFLIYSLVRFEVNNFGYLVLFIIASVSITFLCIFLFGINNEERQYVLKKIKLKYLEFH